MYKQGYFAICDVCGCKFRAKDLIYVANKDSTQYGMLVCPQDLDKVNPGIYDKGTRGTPPLNPNRVRTEGVDRVRFAATSDGIETPTTTLPSGDAPDAPYNLTAYPDNDGYVTLEWYIAGVGSSSIKGYKIERESPVGGGFSTIVTDSTTVAQMYVDKTVSSSTTYNYKISAINYHGTSSASNEAHTTT